MQFKKVLTPITFNDEPSRDGKVYVKSTFTDGKDIITNVYVPTEFAPIVQNSLNEKMTVTIRVKQKDMGKVSLSVAEITNV